MSRSRAALLHWPCMKDWENSDWFQNWIKLATKTGEDPRG